MLRILVPLDGSSLAEAVLPTAANLALRFDAELYLARAAQARGLPGLDPLKAQEDALSDARTYIGQVARRVAETKKVRVRSSVPYGAAAESILVEARTQEIDLIAMSTHGRSGMGRWLFGSVAEAVVREATVPVLLLRPSAEVPGDTALAGWDTILVPLDGSQLAEAILPHAEHLARRLPARLLLTMVVEHVHDVVRRGQEIVAYADEIMRERELRARTYLEQLREQLAARRIEATVEIRFGDPAAEIAAAAGEVSAGLVAMATHARSGLDRWRYGSVAGAVLQNLSVPLLVMRG